MVKFGDRIRRDGKLFTVIEVKPRTLRVRRTVVNSSGSVTLSPNLISLKRKKKKK